MFRTIAACSVVGLLLTGPVAYGQSAGNSAAPAPMSAAPAKRAAYGTPADVAYAKAAWASLKAFRMVGPARYTPYPTKSENPHGNVVQILAGTIQVQGRSTRVIVKSNHRGAGLTPAMVADDAQKFHADTAVMIKREKGYDPASADWFWVVYKPDGSVLQHQGKAVAGRVDTGTDAGCIGCHAKYGGKDFETLTTR